MTTKDIKIAKIKAKIILKEMNHSATLEVHKQINQIANKIIALIRKLIPTMNISESMVEFSDGYAIIRISDRHIDSLDPRQLQLFENSLQNILSGIANKYNNTMINIESSSIEGNHQEDTPEITSLNALIYRLKLLDPLSKVVVCGIKDKPLVSFAPTSLGVEVSQKGKEQLLKETVSGLVITDSVSFSELINYSDDDPIYVTIYTLESNHRFNARLSCGQIKSIVLLSSKISGELTPKEGKKPQMLKEGFVIEN